MPDDRVINTANEIKVIRRTFNGWLEIDGMKKWKDKQKNIKYGRVLN